VANCWPALAADFAPKFPNSVATLDALCVRLRSTANFQVLDLAFGRNGEFHPKRSSSSDFIRRTITASSWARLGGNRSGEPLVVEQLEQGGENSPCSRYEAWPRRNSLCSKYGASVRMAIVR